MENIMVVRSKVEKGIEAHAVKVLDRDDHVLIIVPKVQARVNDSGTVFLVHTGGYGQVTCDTGARYGIQLSLHHKTPSSAPVSSEMLSVFDSIDV